MPYIHDEASSVLRICCISPDPGALIFQFALSLFLLAFDVLFLDRWTLLYTSLNFLNISLIAAILGSRLAVSQSHDVWFRLAPHVIQIPKLLTAQYLHGQSNKISLCISASTSSVFLDISAVVQHFFPFLIRQLHVHFTHSVDLCC